MTSKSLRSSNNLKHNGWQEEKEGKTGIQKREYLKNEKSFLDEIKNVFEQLSFGWNKKLIKNSGQKL